MVFSSVPPYLDPSNWQQQPPPPPINHHHQPDHHPHPPPPPPTHGGGSIRPGSMADRARLANIPMPEGPLKCPRCDSTNTKFCYFNNYNLSQPRHFCKTCRRYWTRGGALRNVPVGGGCRRNKRTKGSSSKPPSSSSATTTAAGGVTSGGMEILGLPNLRAAAAMAPPLQSYLTDFGYGGGGEPPLGLNYGGGGGGAMERLRFTQMTSQFPFMAGSDPYGPFEGTIEPSGFMGLLPPSSRPKTPSSAAEVAAAAVKMENNSSNNNNNNNQDLNLSRQFLGMMNSTSNDQVAWNNGSGAWKMDLSSFGSSTGNNNPP